MFLYKRIKPDFLWGHMYFSKIDAKTIEEMSSHIKNKNIKDFIFNKQYNEHLIIIWLYLLDD